MLAAMQASYISSMNTWCIYMFRKIYNFLFIDWYISLKANTWVLGDNPARNYGLKRL